MLYIVTWEFDLVRLTAYTDYALRVLMHVALRDGERVRIADVADGFGISHNHLTKIVHQLGTLGFLMTVQGRNGGMTLARPAKRITVGEVVRAFEPDFQLVECFEPETSGCRIQSACRLQKAFGDALELFLGRLDGVTLADLIRPSAKLNSLLFLPTKRAATIA